MEQDEQDYCAICGGQLEFMGILGSLHWFKCRACGIMESVENEVADNDALFYSMIPFITNRKS